MGRFDNWYKRRINRIYPTVFAWAILGAFLFDRHYDMQHTIISGGGWFVTCIMMYYVVLYFVRRYMMKYLIWVFTVVFVSCGLWFALTKTPTDFNMYGNTYFKWFHYFLFMMMGAMMGISQKKNTYRFGLDCIKLLASIVLFYVLSAFKGIPSYNKLQFLSIVPLICTAFYFYKISQSDTLKHIYFHKIWGISIRFIGGLCLEIYLVQGALFTDKMNFLFPLNLPIMFLIILIAAYILRCSARIFAQTFKDGGYDWKAVVKAI